MKHLFSMRNSIVVALIVIMANCSLVAQNKADKSYIRTKSGEIIKINPEIGILGWKSNVLYQNPDNSNEIVTTRFLQKSGKIKKKEIDSIIINDEYYITLNKTDNRPYPFRIVAENEEYILGITPRIKSSGDDIKSYFTRDYYGIYNKKGKEIVFDKLNRNKEKSIKVLKKYFGDCLSEYLPTEKSELKSYKYHLLTTVNQLKCD